ncbi:MAG: reverse transcriptase domain-containing protein [Cyanobacteria bacterium J06614_10]
MQTGQLVPNHDDHEQDEGQDTVGIVESYGDEDTDERSESEAEEENEEESWIGKKVYRTFCAPGTNTRYEYEGTVVSTRTTTSEGTLLRVTYEDGDEEELGIEDAEHYSTPKDGGVPLNSEIDEANILPEGSKRNQTTATLAFPEITSGAAKRTKYKEGYLLPKNHAQAMSTPESEQWRAAELKELNAMRDLEVFEEVDYLPEGAKALPLMVLYDVKSDLRFKVRMVARGDLQDPDTYMESYSPVVRISSIRLLLAMSTHYGMEVYSTDISTAYLNAAIDADIYFRAPDFFPKPGAILRARKAIYGLKQAGVCWFLELEEKLEIMGFVRTIIDPCIWAKVHEETTILVTTYVDDLLLIGDDTLVSQTLGELKEYYTCRDDGPIETFLGMKFNKVQVDEVFHFRVDMTQYVQKLVKRHSRVGRNALKRHTTPGSKHDKAQDGEPLPSEQKTLYQSLVGAYQWLSTCMRPDITFATHCLAKRANEPSDQDLAKAWRVLGYLERTAEQALLVDASEMNIPPSARTPSRKLFQKAEGEKEVTQASDEIPCLVEDEINPMEPLSLNSDGSISSQLRNELKQIAKDMTITTFADADFAGETDERKSTTGFVIYLNSTPIVWSSKKIKCAVTSTFEAEFIALSEALKETLYVLQLAHSLGVSVKLPMTMYCDNLSAAYVASNPESEARARHVAIRFHHVRSYVEMGTIQIMHCDSEEMHADIFTKFLPRAQHEELASKIMGQE